MQPAVLCELFSQSRPMPEKAKDHPLGLQGLRAGQITMCQENGAPSLILAWGPGSDAVLQGRVGPVRPRGRKVSGPKPLTSHPWSAGRWRSGGCSCCRVLEPGSSWASCAISKYPCCTSDGTSPQWSYQWEARR